MGVSVIAFAITDLSIAASVIGYSEKVIREFLDLLRNGENGTVAENPVLSENKGLIVIHRKRLRNEKMLIRLK